MVIDIITCEDCIYSEFSKTIDYAYTCKNKRSPCRNRTVVTGDFCPYGLSERDVEAINKIKALPF